MIQDISPSRLFNTYIQCTPEEADTVFVFNKDGQVLVKEEKDSLYFTKLSDTGDKDAVYLFSVDEKKYFLSRKDCNNIPDGFSLRAIRDIRSCAQKKEVFAAFTAYHLNKWYTDNIFCGKCGNKTVHDKKERALRCSCCGNIIYPRINPAVIVGVTYGDSLLITRYKRGYGHNALIAGFTEIGETLEETVAREVMEEAGIKVKNITYYKSQPWGMAMDILTGFYCEADGDVTIRMDEDELKSAKWTKREDIVLQPDSMSLTNEMMYMFRERPDMVRGLLNGR